MHRLAAHIQRVENFVSVGTNLKSLIDSLRIEQPDGCDCEGMREQMDEMGLEWCRRHRAEIIEAVRQNAKEVRWLSKIAAAGPALWSGLAFNVNPLDPVPGLVDEAIRITEAQAEPACPKPVISARPKAIQP